MNIKDKIWVYGHPANCLYQTFKLDKESHVTPVEGLKELNASNIIFVPYKHETSMEKEFPSLQENTLKFAWSIEDKNDVDKVIELKKTYNKLAFGLFDDFLNPENTKNIDYFSIEGLREIKKKLNENDIEMWMVYYEKQIEIDIEPYLDLFDGITFWFWKEPTNEYFEEIVQRFFEKSPNKKRMIGTYLYNFGNRLPADKEKVLYQLERNKLFIEQGLTEGIILHTNAVSHMGFEAYDAAIEWSKKKYHRLNYSMISSLFCYTENSLFTNSKQNQL